MSQHKKVRGPAKSVAEKNTELLDRAIHEALQGKVLLDRHGRPVRDADGNIIMRGPAASILEVARKRAKEVGLNKPSGPAYPADLAERMRESMRGHEEKSESDR